MDRIQKIRNKVWIPDGDLKQFAEENVRVRNETVKKVKALEVQRDHLKKELEGLKKQLTQLENAFEDATLGAQSEAISAYETRRAKLYSELETYDLKVRDVQEAFLVNLLKEGKSLSEAFNHLPEDLLASYQESERASKDYQQVLSEGQALIESEAASGALGANAKSLYEQVQRAKQNYAARAYEYAHLEYVEVTQARDAQDLLLADYVELVMPQYFTITQVKVGELLDQPMNSLEDFRDALKAAEKALSQWRGKVLTSKPEGQDSSLY
jgi:vacuolar-type H+-ATPase subunit I/STV1